MTGVLMTAETKAADSAVTPNAATPAATSATGQPSQQAEPAKEPAKAPEPAKAEPAGKPQGAPEKYEFKATEGREFDAEVLNAYSGVAKELGLTQEAAQKVLDTVVPVLHQRQVQQIEQVKEQWANQAHADKEFGGDKLHANLAVAQKALARFGSPELRTWLEQSGAGNHPELIRFFLRAGKAISEDTFVTTQSGGAASNADPAKTLFPGMK